MLIRYPGGKRKLMKYILPEMKRLGLDECDTFCEPFFGSGSVGLSVLEKNKFKFSVLNDLDYGIYCLWEAVQKYPDTLKYKINQYKPKVDDFFYFKTLFHSSLGRCNLVEVAFMKIALHQMSYSGLGAMAGSPIGGKNQFNKDGTAKKYQIDCRWSPEHLIKNIDKLNKIVSGCFFSNGTWEYAMDLVKDKNAFVYLDPPYFNAGPQLYKHSFNLKQHEKLSEYLKSANFRWLLSYDNADEIKKLYSWAKINEIETTNTINGCIKLNELLIHS